MTQVKDKAMPAPENKMIGAAPNKSEGVCPICGGTLYTQTRHLGGLSMEQVARHAMRAPALPERVAFPESEEELAARTEFYAAKAAADRANDAVVEAHREPVPGGLIDRHGLLEEQPRDAGAERRRGGRIEAASAALLEALELQKQAESAWRRLQAARLRKTSDWRDTQAKAARETMVVKEKKTFANRIAALIGR